jgi:hypothetical protein
MIDGFFVHAFAILPQAARPHSLSVLRLRLLLGSRRVKIAVEFAGIVSSAGPTSNDSKDLWYG